MFYSVLHHNSQCLTGRLTGDGRVFQKNSLISLPSWIRGRGRNKKAPKLWPGHSKLAREATGHVLASAQASAQSYHFNEPPPGKRNFPPKGAVCSRFTDSGSICIYLTEFLISMVSTVLFRTRSPTPCLQS